MKRLKLVPCNSQV